MELEGSVCIWRSAATRSNLDKPDECSLSRDAFLTRSHSCVAKPLNAFASV